MNQIAFFLLNVFFNSFLAFVTAMLLIEGFIALFRIKQGRVAAALRMIPILKLPLDLCFYDFSRWSYIYGINPLLCEKGSRALSIILSGVNSLTDFFSLPLKLAIQCTIPGNLTFTIADLIGYTIPSFYLILFSILLLFCSLSYLIKKSKLYYNSLMTIKALKQHARPMLHTSCNPQFNALIKRTKPSICITQDICGSPFVTGLFFPTIYIPKSLYASLSESEYEAVLIHEIAHIQYRDNIVRFFLDLITAIFWWIPTQGLRKRIEEGQEIGCDSACAKYNIHAADLASAICKTARHMSLSPSPIFAHHLTNNPISKRIKLLLNPHAIRFGKTRFFLNCLASSLAFLIILLGRFWIF